MKIDFSFAVLVADDSVATRAFQNGATYQTPDCDTAPAPIPPGGLMEGAGNYQCQAGAYADCHLTVYQGTRLFEIFQADITGGQATGGTFYAGCEAVWDLNNDYWKSGTPYSRGDFCAGADAAGMPIAPLLAMGSDFEAGAINHALRFRLPDASINMTSYVHPATHIGSNPAGDAMMPMLGARFRLRPDFPVASLPSSGAQLVAQALQKYGMFLADDRTTPLTFDQSASQYIGADDLASLQVSDFAIVASPDAPVTVTGGSSCQRTPVTQ
jgi:serine/threonine-protein kinase